MREISERCPAGVNPARSKPSRRVGSQACSRPRKGAVDASSGEQVGRGQSVPKHALFRCSSSEGCGKQHHWYRQGEAPVDRRDGRPWHAGEDAPVTWETHALLVEVSKRPGNRVEGRPKQRWGMGVRWPNTSVDVGEHVGSGPGRAKGVSVTESAEGETRNRHTDRRTHVHSTDSG